MQLDRPAIAVADEIKQLIRSAKALRARLRNARSEIRYLRQRVADVEESLAESRDYNRMLQWRIDNSPGAPTPPYLPSLQLLPDASQYAAQQHAAAEYQQHLAAQQMAQQHHNNKQIGLMPVLDVLGELRECTCVPARHSAFYR